MGRHWDRNLSVLRGGDMACWPLIEYATGSSFTLGGE